jgi:hypothetical protein
MNFLFILTACISLAWGLWLVRINRWPRVQVKVLKTWEEVITDEGRWSTGWLHAELEYSYKQKNYAVVWRTDLSVHKYLPKTCSMVLDPAHPDQPQLPASWKLPSILIAVALLLSLNVLHQFLA